MRQWSDNFVRYFNKDKAIFTFQMSEVFVLKKRFISSLKGTEIVSLYIILLNFIKNRSRTFWDKLGADSQTYRHINTHRHIHADENNTSPKNKVFGPGNYHMLNMYYGSVIPIILFRMIFCLCSLFDTSLIYVLLHLIS